MCDNMLRRMEASHRNAHPLARTFATALEGMHACEESETDLKRSESPSIQNLPGPGWKPFRLSARSGAPGRP